MDGTRTTLATGLGLSASTQYGAKVVVSENNGEQELDFYIDLNP